MPVTASQILIQVRYTYLNQKCMNSAIYRTDGAAFLTATMLGVLEAFWNDAKTALRAMTSTSAAVGTFDSLYGSEIGGGGGYAEFPVPSAERVGTRGAGDDGEWVSGIMAVGARLTVGTHATRPGQKRFPWLRESDIIGNEFASSLITLAEPAFEVFSTARNLGVPVATGVLHPQVGGTLVLGVPTVFQDITGQLINTSITSQVSRKKGNGS